MESDNKIFILLLSGGAGKRMNSNQKKQFLKLNNIPLFIWSLKTFLSLSINKQITLVHSKEDLNLYKDIISEHINSNDIPNIHFTEGGETRSESVYNGLLSIKETAQNKDFVLIHDSARPLISIEDILKIVNSLKSHSATTLGYTITDTIKQINPTTNEITHHLNRDQLKGILTPQGFHFEVIWNAYQSYISAPYPVTDDTHIVEKQGHNAIVIEGNKNNIKVTTPEDLILAKTLLCDIE